MFSAKEHGLQSASSFTVNFFGGVFFVLMVACFNIFFPQIDQVIVLPISMLAGTIFLIFCEVVFLKVHRRDAVGYLEVPAPANPQRVRIKRIGFLASVGVLLAVNGGFGLFQAGQYDVYWFYAFLFLPFVCLGAFFYIPYADRRLGAGEDKLWHFGHFVCGGFAVADRQRVIEHLRSLVLRGFFLPVMTIYLFHNIDMFFGNHDALFEQELGKLTGQSGLVLLKAFITGYSVFAMIDLFFALAGYLVVSRMLDTDIRSTDSTLLGWTVCLLCYFPFWELFFFALVADLYAGGNWQDWFIAMPPALIVIWGSLVVFGMFAESFSTLSFGLRFSNLTYRGLICNGMFRFTKHPQYVSKMLNRFVYFMPFLALDGSVFTAMERMALFCLICFVYYLRARTEENHLSRYPEYVRYATLMNHHSLFRFAGRILPFLVYSEEKAKAGKLF